MVETHSLEDWEPLPAERKLAESVGTGQIVQIGDGTLPPEDLPEDDPRVIRTGFLRALILGRIKGHTPHEKGVRVRGAYLRGGNPDGEKTHGLDLEGCDLQGDIALLACRIPDHLLLRSASLRNLFLNGSHLASGLSADGLAVSHGIQMRGLVANGGVRMLGARVAGNLEFDAAQLTAKAGLRWALNAEGVSVKGNVFLRSVVPRSFWIPGQKVGDLHRRFIAHGEVSMSGAWVGGNLDCSGAQLTAISDGDALGLQSVRVEGVFQLSNETRVVGVLDMVAARLENLADDLASWPPDGKLVLDRCCYGAFVGKGTPVDARSRIRWLSLQDERRWGQDFWPQPWEECARVLRAMGHEADARAVLIEKEKRQRRARRDRLRREHLYEDAAWFSFWDALMGITTRYGRQPLLAFAWLAGLILLGLGVFEGARNAEALKPNDSIALRSAEWVDCVPGAERYSGEGSQLACFLEQPEGRGYPAFNPLVYSADALLPIFDLGMQEYWVADENTGFGQGARVYLWVHITLGWALSLLAVAGFSGLIRTDNTT